MQILLQEINRILNITKTNEISPTNKQCILSLFYLLLLTEGFRTLFNIFHPSCDGVASFSQLHDLY